ncbi:hypothetical protein F2P45_29675 [Massilia sp. CCM 8733]|uniref:Uncharacterized protein n=1 Tax=Massilia mucilaginosa TaxID=2609282 RepID=A0ABX0P232_9BURK|nr:hypothetical protein [Massilia mucilaginosa]NHZ93149.1 hypothetical protein [Massilia mucilaginosa]
MLTISSITVQRGRVAKTDLGAALTNLSADLTAPATLSGAAGASFYLPRYRPAAQQQGGHEAFATSLDADGTLTLFLEAGMPDDFAGERNGVAPLMDGTAFTLVLAASAVRFPLRATAQGAMLRLSVQLAGAQRDLVRAALFDATPNVAIEVQQTVLLAAPQSSAFIEHNWANDTLRTGLLNQFGGIPFDSASSYFQMASDTDPDFAHQYLLLACVYSASVGVPPLPGYVQWQVSWNGRAYNYYQDNREHTHVFFLPDRFEFARGPSGAATVSLLQFSVPDDATSIDQTRAIFRYFGNPVVDRTRIDDAARALRERLGLTVQMINIEDGHDVKKTFSQYLPNSEASSESGNLTVQRQADVNLARGLSNTLDLNLTQFRALWAAICSEAPEKTLFRGWVDIELSAGRYADRIDFDGRLAAGNRTSFLDDILDVSTSNTYAADFKINTVPAVFKDHPELLEIALTFAGNKVVLLEPDTPKATVRLERPIRDIILGQGAANEHPYQMRVVHDDGTEGRANFSINCNDPSLWIKQSMIDACTDGA